VAGGIEMSKDISADHEIDLCDCYTGEWDDIVYVEELEDGSMWVTYQQINTDKLIDQMVPYSWGQTNGHSPDWYDYINNTLDAWCEKHKQQDLYELWDDTEDYKSLLEEWCDHLNSEALRYAQQGLEARIDGSWWSD
jgi:hypothetical protein